MLLRSLTARVAVHSLAYSLCSQTALAAEPPHDDDEGRPLEEVVVTARPQESNQDELAEAVNVLDRDHIQSHGGTTVGEVLDGEPGIATSGFAPGASRPVIRGLDSFRVRVLQDGLGTHGVAEISADHGEPINPLSAERVEVVRGPATLRYGGGAIGGVVNAITNRIPLERIDAPVRGDLFAGYGSVAEDRMFAGEVEGGLGPVAWHVDGLRRATSDYGVPSSSDVQDNTETDSYAIGGGGALVGELGRVGLGYGRYIDDYGVSEPGEEFPPTIQIESQNFDSHADLNLNRFELGRLRWRGRYTDYTHDEVVMGDAASTFDAETFEGRIEWLHDPLGPFVGAAGFHFLTRELKAEGEAGELLAPADTDLFAGYLFEDVALSKDWRIELGGRVEHDRVRGTAPPPEFGGSGNDRSRRFVPLSGSAGLVWSPEEKVTLGLTGSASQRAPDALELFAMGPHEADATFQKGEPNADEETSYTVELNANVHFERVSFHGAVFYSYYDGFLFGRLTGATCTEEGDCTDPPDAELDELVYEQQTAHFAGFELTSEVPIWTFEGLGQVGLDAQLDWVRGWLPNDHNVPRLPPLRWGSGVYFAGERVRARFGFLRHERQWFQGENETETAGYTMLDADTTVRLFGDEQRALHLVLGLDNINDARARNHVSFKKEDQRLPGRSVRVGLRGTF